MDRIEVNTVLLVAEKKGMNLKKNLRLLLAERNMTASQLSRKTGVSKATLSDWLSGSSPKNISKVKLVADVLGVSVDDLVFHDGLKTQSPHLEQFREEILTGVFEVVLRKVK